MGLLGINFDPLGALATAYGSYKSAEATKQASADQLQATRETNELNAQLAREQQQWSEQMVDKQNAYNSPVQQMARYQEAGLNPNLIYGTGTASAGNQMVTPSYQRAEMQTPDVMTPGVARAQNIIQLASMFAGLRGQLAMAKKAEADADSTAIRTQFDKDSYEARLYEANSRAAGAQILNSKMIEERALIRQQTLHEQLKQLLTKSETAKTDAVKNLTQEQINKVRSDIAFNDSVIALNQGKLDLQKFEKMWTLQQMQESSARIGLIGEQTASQRGENLYLGNYSSDLDVMDALRTNSSYRKNQWGALLGALFNSKKINRALGSR